MHVQKYSVTFTTDASGDATVYAGGSTEPNPNGRILSVYYDYVDAATGADFTVTAEDTATPLLTITNAGTSDIRWQPRQPTHDVTGAASLYAVSGEPVEDYIFISNERIKVVVAQGGDTKTGTLTFYVG